MIKEWRRRRAARRVRPGDGRPLRPFRWWQLLSRALFYLRLTHDDGRQVVYAIDVMHGRTDGSGVVHAHLYVDGRQHARSGLPAAFPVHGGTVEVSTSAFGLGRCHYVTTEGAEHPLVPDRDSAEGRRAYVDRAHPELSRWVGHVSSAVLVVALLLLASQLGEQLTRPEEIARHVGAFTSPVDLSAWGNVLVGLGATAASTERALRLRHHWLLDGGAG
ncbi:hypothetical protein SMD44_00878 [Streptomyces alboflavus]|uniref:Uncharacterized protein n=1 Tax=Streptomyces alboflavus TaxID=67267 RepID=A0A1Z1W4Z6_9ACTN|nr:hypothetical protein [Streptomyces alboflavus]ARX81480.1 hypothetical protein SMD44_00878 [Streptomyces alboflavus]